MRKTFSRSAAVRIRTARDCDRAQNSTEGATDPSVRFTIRPIRS
ncbi:hypothetical protein BN996_00014 [Haloferax massiliensis]|nr:hypothetical protein BN996_00014 [Haloferax massiliensis]